MQDLQKLETQELIDLMSYLTSELTSSLAEKSTGLIQQFEYDISMIQSEINSRKQNKSNTSVSGTDPEFISETT